MNDTAEALNETGDIEAKLEFAQRELSTLKAKAAELEQDSEAKAKAFADLPSGEAFTATKVADQLAKNAHRAAEEYEAGIQDLVAAVSNRRGERRLAELEPLMDVRNRVTPHASRIFQLISDFAEALRIEVDALGDAIAEQRRLEPEASTLARRHGGQTSSFRFPRPTMPQVLAEYVQPFVSTRLGELKPGPDINHACVLHYMEPGGPSQATVELTLRSNGRRYVPIAR
jgi:hypothetical protein